MKYRISADQMASLGAGESTMVEIMLEDGESCQEAALQIVTAAFREMHPFKVSVEEADDLALSPPEEEELRDLISKLEPGVPFELDYWMGRSMKTTLWLKGDRIVIDMNRWAERIFNSSDPRGIPPRALADLAVDLARIFNQANGKMFNDPRAVKALADLWTVFSRASLKMSKASATNLFDELEKLQEQHPALEYLAEVEVGGFIHSTLPETLKSQLNTKVAEVGGTHWFMARRTKETDGFVMERWWVFRERMPAA